METPTKTVAPTQGEAAPKKLKKKIKVVASETDQKNLENAKEKIKKERDLIYNYEPADMSGEDKKKFRTRARNTRDSFHSKIQKAKPEEVEAIRLEARKWAKMTYAKKYRDTEPTVQF